MPAPSGEQWKNLQTGTMKAKDLVNLVAYEFPDEGVNNTSAWPTRAYKDVPGALESMVSASKEPESVEPHFEDDNYENLYDNIKATGVRDRVNVKTDSKGNMMLRDGHHRVAVAHDIDPEMDIPVLFT